MLSTMTSKGQVTLPKKFRDYLGVKSGAAVDFSLSPDGKVIVRAADIVETNTRHGRFDHLRGTLEATKNTDALMALLRGYDEDEQDPGLQ